MPKNIWTNISDLIATVIADPLKLDIDKTWLYSLLSSDNLNACCYIQMSESKFADWYTDS